MDNLYLQSIYEYLLTKREENKYSFNISIYTPQERTIINKNLSTGDWSFLPHLYVASGYKYVTTELQNNSMDFSKELPAILTPNITIWADNISDVVEMEKVISELFYDTVQLKAKHPYYNNEYITFDIAMNRSEKVNRKSTKYTYPNGDRTLYQTIIKPRSSGATIFMRNFHPAEIELDKYVQLELVERGYALEELKKQTNILTAEQVQQICSGRDEIMSLLNISAFDGFGFYELFQIMSDKKCDIKTAMNECLKALEEITERKRQEEERINRINERYEKMNKKGDSVINRYTDAVIDDIISSFNHFVPIYGGKRFLKWQYCSELDKLEYPNILVTDFIEFSFIPKEYQTIDNEGNTIIRPFSTEILPINLQLKIEIYAKSHAQCEELTNCILGRYTNPKVVMVDLPIHENETFLFTIHYDEKNSKIKERRNNQISQNNAMRDGDTYINELWLYSSPCIYYKDEKNEVDISNNRRLQINLLQQAIFFGEYSKKVNNLVVPLADYKYMVSKKVSMLSFLYSKEVKKLKHRYNFRLSLDRELFNRTFSNIIALYPNLYEKTIQGWSYEQVEADINRYSELFNQKFTEIHTLLNIRFNSPLIRTPAYSLDNLRKYVKLMKKNRNMLLSEAITITKENTLNKTFTERVGEQEDSSNACNETYSESAHQRHESYKTESNSFDRARKESRTQANAPDLMGSYACMYGKKKDGWTVHCDISCPVYFQCSRGGGKS